MASQYFMDLLTVVIFLLIGYTVSMAEGRTCNSTIPHGRVNCYTFGYIRNIQKCLYSCDPGYQTHPLVSGLSCDSHTGRWTLDISLVDFMYNFPKFDEEVLCSPRICPNSIPNGFLSENCEAVVDSPPCNYTCENGFVKTTQASLTCLHTARWNRDLFSLCAAKDGKQCSWILPDADLDLSCDRRPGSTCTYKCRTPYHSLNSPPNIICQKTDLRWSHKKVCSSVKCPQSFPGGRISVLCDTYEGSTCAMQCDDGYIARNYSLQATCLSSGQWNPNPTNLCQKTVKCPQSFPGGRISVLCDTYEGSTCAVQCDYGFIARNYSLQATCLSSGQWNPNPTNLCQKNSLCPAFVPNGVIASSCSRRESATCNIYCNAGYTLRLPGMTATCLSYGRWDVDVSNICVFENSLCPAFVPNGWISSSCSRRESATCSIYCNAGYTLSLPGMTATCLSSGRWDADLSNICVFENSLCPAFVSNGWISSSCSRRESATCSIYCNAGYTLSLPGMTATCLSSGRWDIDLSNVCMFEYRDSGSSESEAPASYNIIIPLTLVIAAVTTIIVGIIIACFRSRRQSRGTGSRSPHDETSSNSHIPAMYSVGQCRIGCNLDLRSGAQTSFQAHDMNPPPYTEVMKNNRSDLAPPPSYEEVNACPSSFLPDSYI